MITTTSNGVVTFTNAGTLNINGNIGADGAVTQNGAGAVAFGGAGTRTITTTADDVNFLRAVTLSRPVTIATAGTGAGTGDVTFQSTVDSATGQTLGVTAAGSSVLFTGAVGGTNRLGAVTITSAKDVTESAGLKAASLVQSAGTGLTLLTGAVDTNTAAGVSLTTAGAITVNNTITTTTGASGGGVAFSNGGLLTINGDITSDGNVTQAGGGNVTITAPRTITTTGDLVSFANNVTLNGGAAGLVSINTTSGSATGNNITFSGTLTATTAAANEEKLTLNAGTGGDITFTGAVGATRLGDVTITNARNISVNSTFASASLLQSAGTGTTSTSAGNLNTDNSQAGNGVQIATNNITIGTGGITTTNNGVVTLTNAGTLTVNGQINAAGNVTQNGAGSTVLNADIVTNRALVQFAKAVLLSGSRLIDTTPAGAAGGTIQFDGAVNGAGNALTLKAPTATGDIIFNAAASNLSSLTINSGRNLTVAPAGSITTNAGGSIDVTIGGLLTNSGTISNSGGAGAVRLTADKMNLAGTITAGSGAVSLTSFTPGNTIDLGSTTDVAANTLELSNAELNSITTTGTLTIGSTPTVLNHTGNIVASTGNNVTFTNPSGLVILQTSGGNINVNSTLRTNTGNLKLDTTGAGATTGGVFDPNGTGMLRVTGGNNLTLTAGSGIGTLAKPVHTDTSSLTATDTTSGDVYIQNSGAVTLATAFKNQGAGQLWLETLNGALNTSTVPVSTAGGRMILTASDTSGGNNAQINIGSGGLASSGGKIALHGADVITIGSGAGVVTSGGAVEIISGTGAGLNVGAITLPASESAADDFGAIYIGAPINAGAGNTLLVASTTATASIIAGVVQGVSSGTITGTSPIVSSINPSTGAAVGTTGPITTNTLTVVTLRGGGGAGNGGAAIDLQNAANTSGTINLFACPVIGCPDTPLPGGTRTTGPFVTAPMINNTNAPNAAVTPGKYGDGPIFYVDTGGTAVSGVGTVNDFTFYTPGNVTINTVQQARNLKLEASGNIDVSLTAPVDNTVILKNGSLQLVAGNNINYNPAAAGNTFGSVATTFNRNLSFIAAGAIDINNAIYQGNDVTVPATPVVTTLVIKANQDVSMNNGGVNVGRKDAGYAGAGLGDVIFRGNNEVSNLGGMTVEGVNIKVLGGNLGGLNQSSVGENIKSAGTINFNATFTPSAPPASTGSISLIAGASTGTSDSGAIVNGGNVNIGSASVRSKDLVLTGGSNTVNSAASHHSDASILSAGQINILLAGNATLTGGTATANGAAATATSTSLANIAGGNISLDALGNVSIVAGTATANSGLSTLTTDYGADASASIVSQGAFAPKIGNDLKVVGGSSSATPTIAGQVVHAKAQGILEGKSLNLTVGHDLLQDNSLATATADASVGGGAKAVASSSSLLATNAGDKTIKVSGKWDMIGGTATSNGGTGATANTLVATTDSDNALGAIWKLTAQVSGNMNLTGGFQAGSSSTSASSAVVLGAPGNIVLTTAHLTLTGNSGSGLFNTLPGNTVLRMDGTHIPITVNGNGSGITIVSNALLDSAFVLSGAPATNTDALQSSFIAAIQTSSNNRTVGSSNDVNNAKNKPVDASKVCK